MHLTPHLSSSYRNWRFWGLVILALLALALLGAEPIKPDPVEAVRRALRPPTAQEFLLEDSTLAKQLRDANDQGERREIVLQSRARLLARRLQALHALPHLRQAILLEEWRQPNEAGEAVDSKLRALLIQRFAREVRQGLKSENPTYRLAVLSMIAEMGVGIGLPDAKRGIGQLFELDLVEVLKQSDAPPLREAAARALGQVYPDPKVAVPALASLLQSPVLTDRRAAAGALGKMISVPSQGRSRRWLPNIEVERSDVITVGMSVLPVVAPGLDDVDSDVRRLSADVFRQVALALDRLADERPPQEFYREIPPEPAEIPQYLTILRMDLKPFVHVLRDQVPKLSGHLNDSDLGTCLAVNQALEAIAEARLRLRKIRQSDPAPTDKHLDDLLAESLRFAPPGLAKELSHKDLHVRLAALYVLETLEADAAPAASAVVEALKDDNSFVRWGAVRTLGNMAPLEPAKAVPGLAGVIDDANGNVRGTALIALRHYGPAAKAAVPALSRTINQGDVETRRLAIEAIAAIGPNAADAVPALIASLTAPQAEIRLAAAKALGQLGPSARQAEAALLKTLKDPNPDIRIAAAEALLLPK